MREFFELIFKSFIMKQYTVSFSSKILALIFTGITCLSVQNTFAQEEEEGLPQQDSIALQQDFAAGRLVELNIGQRDLTRRLYVLVQRHKFISAGMARWMRLCKISGY
jgi:hypothetical protein